MRPILKFVRNRQVHTVLDTYRELSWTHRVNDVGGYYVGTHQSPPIERNDIVYIERFNGLNWYTEWVGLQLQEAYSRFSNRNYQTIYSGDDLGNVLKRRIIDYPKESVYAYKTGYTQDVMVAYIHENLGTGATNSNRRSGSGYLTGFEVVPTGGINGGIMWDGDLSGNNLFTALQDMSSASDNAGSPVDFQVVWVNNHFQANVHKGRLGTDRSSYMVNPLTGLNSNGNRPVIFSPEYNNIDELRTSRGGAETNVVVITSQDEENNPTYQVLTDEQRIDADNLNRWEKEVSSSGDGASVVVGNKWLAEYRVKNSLDFTYRISKHSRYGLDWFNGDLVTVIDQTGTPRHKRIMTTTVIITGDNEEQFTIELDERDFFV